MSCSRIERENPLTLIGNNNTVSDTVALKVLKEEVVSKQSNFQETELPKTSTSNTIVFEKELAKKKSPLKQPEKKPESEKEEKTQTNSKLTQATKKSATKEKTADFIFDDKYYPVTRDDALRYAFECYKKAKNMTNMDSVKIISKKGLSIYENASLYYLFAKALSAEGNNSLATNNCKTAISRNDFWGDEQQATLKLLVENLQKTYEKTPSALLLSQMEKYKGMIK
jgi:hypothetical protein